MTLYVQIMNDLLRIAFKEKVLTNSLLTLTL